VFASKALHDRLVVRALNAPSEWKDSDHCQISIELHEKAVRRGPPNNDAGLSQP
jgi:hypothetical protein